MQFTDRKILPYEPKAKFTDRYSAGILDNPLQQGKVKTFSVFSFYVYVPPFNCARVVLH